MILSDIFDSKEISDLTKSKLKFVPNIGVTLSAGDVMVTLQGHLKCPGYVVIIKIIGLFLHTIS